MQSWFSSRITLPIPAVAEDSVMHTVIATPRVRISPTNPVAMPSKVLRVALCLRRGVDLEAYTQLIEGMAHARVLVRTTQPKAMLAEAVRTQVDLLVIDGELALKLGPVELTTLNEDHGVAQVAILASDRLHNGTLGDWPVVSDLDHLRPLLGDGRPAAADGSGDRPDFSAITRREQEVWRLIAQGKSVRVIAETMKLAESTIDSHKSRLMRKLKVHKSLDLVRLAVIYGILDT
jgi:DNA-binding CsgD family transcriptional regulator